jgi:hypothetical protein
VTRCRVVHLDDVEALASLGRRDEALAALRIAIDREPELRDAARTDDDLAGLRDDPDFVAVVTR